MKRGFSLVELVIAVGLSVVIGMMCLQALHAALATEAQAQSTQYSVGALDVFATRLERDAASSDAVWVTQDTDGDILNFSLIDGSGISRHWMYRFTTQLVRVDATTNTITSVPEAQGITKFMAAPLRATAIAQQTNGFADLFGGLPPPVDMQYTVDANGVAGNVVSVVTLQAGPETRIIHLLASPTAAAFGIEQGVFWHSVVWRSPHTQRSFFGLIQKSSYDILAEVSFTNDNWATSHVWCSYEVFANLDVGDPRARSDYYDPSENANAVFARCQKQTGQRSIPTYAEKPMRRVSE